MLPSGCRDDLLGVDAQAGGRCGLFGVAQLHERLEQLGRLARAFRVRLGEHPLAAVDVAVPSNGIPARIALILGSSRGSAAMSYAMMGAPNFVRI